MITTETWDFWVIIWVLEFAVLTHYILKNDLIKIDATKLVPIGLLVVVFASFLYLVFNLAIFTSDELTTICMFSHLDIYLADNEKFFGDSTDEDKVRNALWKCYNDSIDLKWTYFKISMIMAILVVFGNVFQAVGRKTNRQEQPTVNTYKKSPIT